MSICLLKLEVGFWTYGFVNLLGLIGPKLVFRPLVPNELYVLIFRYNILFSLKSCINWGLVAKIGYRSLDLWLCKSFCPNWPKTSSYAPDHKGYFSCKIFPVKLHKILHKLSLVISEKWMVFDKVMRVYPQKTTKKPSKISVFGATPSMKFPFNSCPQKVPFLGH